MTRSSASDPERWRRLGVGALGKATAAYLGAVGAGISIAGAELGFARLEAARSGHAGRKLVLFYWIESVLPMMLVLSEWRRRVAQDHWSGHIELLCDDTYSGRVTARTLEALGLKVRCLHWLRPAARLRDLQTIMRSNAPMGIAVDGHGPYGRVGETFSALLTGSAAVGVPLATAVHRPWFVPVHPRLVVPPPRARIAFAAGDPVIATEDRARSARTLQMAMAAAEEASRASLAARLGEPMQRREVAGG